MPGSYPLAIHLVESIMHQRCAEVYLDFIYFDIGSDTYPLVTSTVYYTGEHIHGCTDVVGWVSYPRGLFSLSLKGLEDVEDGRMIGASCRRRTICLLPSMMY